MAEDGARFENGQRLVAFLPTLFDGISFEERPQSSRNNLKEQI